MKDYNVKVRLVLKTSFLQSGKNKKEIEDKTEKVIRNAINNSKVLHSLFSGKNSYKMQLEIKQMNNNK